MHHLPFAIAHVVDLAIHAGGDCSGIDRSDGTERVDVNADRSLSCGCGRNGDTAPRPGCFGLGSLVRSLLVLVVTESHQTKQENQHDPDPSVASALGWLRAGLLRRRWNPRWCAGGMSGCAVGFCQIGKILGHLNSSL